MRLLSKRTAAGWLLGLVMTASCGSQAPSGGDESSTAGETTEPSSAGSTSDGHVGIIRRALASVSLRADQKTAVAQLGAEADARLATVQDARSTLRAAMAAQVEAGAVDRNALAPEIAGVETAGARTRAADWAAVEQLHALLDGGQRAQLVDAVQTEMAARHGTRGHFRGMRQWATALGLTDAQLMKIHDAAKGARGEAGMFRHRMGGARAAGQAVLDAFRGDRLVIDDSTKASFDQDGARLKRTLDLIEIGLPVLTPAQRNLAAQRLRSPDAEQ